jgi:beta-galactosidase
MWLGIDYYPEHWPLELLESDLDKIVDMGANAIRIGEFAWHLIESAPGRFDFSFFDLVIEKAKARGLSIVYGTPTATFPAWLHHMHPEVLSEDASGVKRSYGGRRVYCYNSDVYRSYTLRIVEALVKHYRDEAGLFMWQIDNELGHEGSDDCYCSDCHEAFRRFLKAKYVTIQSLNQVYGTIFWGQTYNGFDEIPMPTPTITTHNPVLKLDWARFRSESIYSFAMEQIDCVRRHKGAHQQVTHNYFGGYFDRRYDQTRLSCGLDVVAFDNYPVWGGLMKPMSPAEIAMGHDYMRGLKNQNFWVMEQLIGAQGHDDIGYLPRDGQSSLWASQAMARGCESLFYFRERGLHKGAEQFCQGILDADNTINDKYREVQAFFKTVKEYERLLKTPIKSEVAILYDYDNRWSWHGQRQSKDFDYTKEVLRCYRPFHKLNVAIDVVDVQKSWADYKVLILPVMQLMDQELTVKLKAFVAEGGTVLLSFRSAIKDKDNNIVFGEKAPVYLNEFVGATVKTYEALAEGITVDIQAQDWQIIGTGCVWRDLLEPTTARTIFHYVAPYEDYAACTVNAYGQGQVYYVATGLDDPLMDQVADLICQDTGLETIETPDDVEVVIRGTGEQKRYWVLNHNHEAVTFKGITLKALEVQVLESIMDK